MVAAVMGPDREQQFAGAVELISPVCIRHHCTPQLGVDLGYHD